MKKLTTIIIALLLLMPAVVRAEGERLTMNIARINRAPVIDGTVQDGEWGAPVCTFTPESGTSYAALEKSADDVEAALPQSATLYLRWDADYLYGAMIIKDAVHFNERKLSEGWIGDSLEFDIGTNLEKQSVRYRINMSLSSDGSTALWEHNGPLWDNSELAAGNGLISQDKGECKITRDETNKTTTYEFRFTWFYLTSSYEGVKTGHQLYINPQIHVANGIAKATQTSDPDNTTYLDYLGFVRYGTKDAQGNALYPLATLMDAPAGDPTAVPSAGTTAPQTTNTPGTGDNGNANDYTVILIIAAVLVVGVITAVVIIVLNKKKQVK